jgi:hypothetical protein
MKKEDLQKIIDDDDMNLLVAKTGNSSIVTPNERLKASFDEINQFIEENNREPKEGQGVSEHRLATRLSSIREDKNKIQILEKFDKFELLGVDKKEIYSVNDVFEDDLLEILDKGAENIFDIKNIPQKKDRDKADFVARRKPCGNFRKFENLFKECQKDLSLGKRKLIKFNENQLKKGNFFVANGILLFIEELFETKKDENGKIDGRIRCIFENGTESGMLLRSLGKILYENGQAVSENSEMTKRKFFENFNIINKKDKKTGFIYVLRSLSKDSRISSIENLYKIGYSNVPVEERIKNAKEEPTYLMAPVHIETTFECYNVKSKDLEQLLHNFFGSACLNLDIFDKKGKRHSPREWFIAPLRVIERAVEMIISGGIVNYKYDSDQKKIVLR